MEPAGRILVVDDSSDNREAVCDLLRLNGLEVMEAADADAALRLAAEFRPHLYLLDVVMPGISGLDLLKQLRVKDNTYEAVVMTGHESLEDARRAMELGALSYVGKPIKHEELMQHVRRALASARGAELRNQYQVNLQRDVAARTKEILI